MLKPPLFPGFQINKGGGLTPARDFHSPPQAGKFLILMLFFCFFTIEILQCSIKNHIQIKQKSTINSSKCGTTLKIFRLRRATVVTH